MFLKLVNEFIRQDPLAGLFVGTVVDNNDPKKKGRVRCTIPGMLEGESSDIPWVYPQMPFFLGDGASAMLSVPEVGSKIFIQFPNRDIYFPVYVGSSRESAIPADLLADYPNSYGFVDSTGFKIIYNKTQKALTLEHPSGTKVTVDQDGNLVVNVAKALTLEVEDKTDVVVKGDVNATFLGKATVGVTGDLEVTGQANIKASAIQNVEVTGTAEVKITAGGNVTVQGAQILLN